MLFDVNTLFFYTGSFSPGWTAGNFVTLVGVTGSGLVSTAIDMGVAEDLGIGSGTAIPKVALYVGTTGVTSASAGTLINVQFRGSTDSTNWTVYAESGPLTTASFTAGSKVFPIDVPHRLPGAALPRYYDINLAITGISPTSQAISTGSIIGGIVLSRDDQVGAPNYPSNFTVV